MCTHDKRASEHTQHATNIDIACMHRTSRTLWTQNCANSNARMQSTLASPGWYVCTCMRTRTQANKQRHQRNVQKRRRHAHNQLHVAKNVGAMKMDKQHCEWPGPKELRCATTKSQHTQAQGTVRNKHGQGAHVRARLFLWWARNFL
jgi:hypothetical protein